MRIARLEQVCAHHVLKKRPPPMERSQGLEGLATTTAGSRAAKLAARPAMSAGPRSSAIAKSSLAEAGQKKGRTKRPLFLRRPQSDRNDRNDQIDQNE